MKKQLQVIMVSIVAVLGVLWFLQWQRSVSEQQGVTGGETAQAEAVVQVGGPFTLLNTEGKEVNSAEFAGKYLLVYFGYTFCPDICPVDIMVLSQAVEQLGEKAPEIVPIFITVDPARDTPQHLKNYMTSFSSRIVALSGTLEQTDAAAKAYRVYYSKVVEPGKENDPDYLVDHSAFTYLMDRKGKYVTHFAHGTSAADMAKAVSEILDKEKSRDGDDADHG